MENALDAVEVSEWMKRWEMNLCQLVTCGDVGQDFDRARTKEIQLDAATNAFIPHLVYACSKKLSACAIYTQIHSHAVALACSAGSRVPLNIRNAEIPRFRAVGLGSKNVRLEMYALDRLRRGTA